MHQVLWEPKPNKVAASHMVAFAHALGIPMQGEDHGYDVLWRWSVDHRAEFWSAVWDYCEILGSKGKEILAHDAMPGAKWFPEARLNFAENLLAPRGEQEALVFRHEDGRRFAYSRDALREQVRCFQASLENWGVEQGDCVVGFLPNCLEAVIAMLATSSLGAIWSSCSPDFGIPGVLDRFGQIAPKIIIAADGYTFKGRPIVTLEKLEQIVEALPSLEQVVLLPFLDPSAASAWCSPSSGETSLPRHLWEATVHASGGHRLHFLRLAFDHPLYVMFSSGTTGPPKCIVHGQGGTLLQHRKEHVLHCDLRAGERLFYYTTTGWMMWNWLVSGLATGATVVLFDGNPFYPSAAAMWNLIDLEHLHIFGTSAKFLDASKKAALLPKESHHLQSLRLILSTGSPLVPESFDWVYSHVKKDLQLASITGGTDLLSCFALGCPIAPVRRGELQKRGLGMAVEVWTENQCPVVGQPGELVCTQSFPSMPTGFWNDPEGVRFRAAYFEVFPDIWCHGDWVELTSHQGLVVYGRSDATLNPGGVRIGTAEIYRQVEQIQQVEEAVVIAQSTGDGDQRVVLFVRLREGILLDGALQGCIRDAIRSQTTPRHVPAVICAVSDIPRTRSGKISEIAVRDAVHGRPVKNTEALANPESLQEFQQRPELALDF